MGWELRRLKACPSETCCIEPMLMTSTHKHRDPTPAEPSITWTRAGAQVVSLWKTKCSMVTGVTEGWLWAALSWRPHHKSGIGEQEATAVLPGETGRDDDGLVEPLAVGAQDGK
ncbi:hypothetical protein JMJ77_0015145 [Colletotrichum scovillei]|uniref:Uncharacterized protein n=1 Tax=Colletotrichum scovillei TaxID=1209932 RepID=A0A9P7UA36_9PEZI|nr:hypothetical protein JMJ77_0015145 [Colletotrichum scovillei]KAG7056767.1 hypothetical protein JMJ78_0000557 [Colletotrichum scovillei]KAG7066692.1 hypothetical protein JMJ76_0000546 [Colletotrichum scovillei]